jgi:RNA polymerase sigma factor (sigma-70 family)
MDAPTDPSTACQPPADLAIAAIIRRKARALSRAAVAFDDESDLAQELALAVLRSRPKFDPKRGTAAAFAAGVVDRRAVSLLRYAGAEKRCRRGVLSLNVEVLLDNEERVELAATISQQELDARTRAEHRSDEDVSDVSQDVEAILARVPQDDRELVRALKWRTVAEIARTAGVPRTTVQSRVFKYRQLFEDAGLRAYLQ